MAKTDDSLDISTFPCITWLKSFTERVLLLLLVVCFVLIFAAFFSRFFHLVFFGVTLYLVVSFWVCVCPPLLISLVLRSEKNQQFQTSHEIPKRVLLVNQLTVFFIQSTMAGWELKYLLQLNNCCKCSYKLIEFSNVLQWLSVYLSGD